MSDRLVYKPEGVEPIVWPWDWMKLPSDDAEEFERLTGTTYMAGLLALDNGSMLARRALVFVHLRRTRPDLDWDTFKISYADVDLEADDPEPVDNDGGVEADPTEPDGETPSEEETTLTT